MTMKAPTLALSMLAIGTAQCTQMPTLFPSRSPPPSWGNDPSTIPTVGQTSSPTPTHNPSLILSKAATHSKMSPTLLALHRSSSTETSAAPTGLPTPTAGPVVPDRLSFLPMQSEDDGVSFSDTEVRCNSGLELTAPRKVELPYYYQIDIADGTYDGALLKWIDSSLLNALASILTCTDEDDEEIRRSLMLGVQDKSRVIAAYLVPGDSISNEYTCPTNSKAQSCHIVEAKLALVTQGGGEGQDNDTVIERAYTAVKLALLALDGGQDRVRLHYLGNNPMSLASKLSKRVDYDISDEDISGIFAVIFVVVFICGLLAMVAFLVSILYDRARRKAYRRNRASDEDVDGKSSTGVPSTIEVTLSASRDDEMNMAELGISSPNRCTNENTEPRGKHDPNWCRFIFLESLALGTVPEEESSI